MTCEALSEVLRVASGVQTECGGLSVSFPVTDVLSHFGRMSGADDGDKVLAGLQDTAFRTIAQLLQPSEDDGLKEYLGAMESIADAIFASNL
ncbi:hypothetical protein BLNAU_4179 [Blattamonas nauphoetae]|uniref:Uncharacterized protein n=1 Tax=Blattamonas nauphoetae TaxID=2049346 RepID=A0ABQ9YAH5_9EUKA|nr:hypothetical protein BLNAU_4179 [Blattamonas nauphoetae]